jgi:hypothetical protein
MQAWLLLAGQFCCQCLAWCWAQTWLALPCMCSRLLE